ncbi:MAG: protein kinase [Anaerolineae bacterium]|nr:protein kinase [Anaerolineae bacterium]
MAEDLAGKVIGKYQLHERVGRGGMAEVYKGYQASLDRFVAIKILHPFLGDDPEFRQRFESEARNVAQLRHPNIVQVYDFEFDPQREVYYMVMEYVDGPTLRTDLMQYQFEGRLIAAEDAIRIAYDVASALAYAHSRHMIHRDIKPAHIILDSSGRTVLTDFGIARIINGPTMTASGSMVGTPAYMSPEQGLGQSGDHRSDIYSLGVVLYQMLTGSPPYDADTPIAIVLKHINDPIPDVRRLNPTISPHLEPIIYRALAKSPAERYQDVGEMAQNLLAIKASRPEIVSAGDPLSMPSVPVKQPAPPSVPVPPSRQAPRKSGFWAATLLAAFSFAVGTYLAFTGILSSQFPQFVPVVDLVLTPLPTESTTDLLALTTLPPLPAVPEEEHQPPTATASLMPLNPAQTPPVCNYSYVVLDQTPENGAIYPELTLLVKEVVIRNTSQCPFEFDTRLVFEDGAQMDGPPSIRLGETVQPGTEVNIRLELRTPAYNPNASTISSSWQLVLADGTLVGAPLTFRFTILDTPG